MALGYEEVNYANWCYRRETKNKTKQKKEQQQQQQQVTVTVSNFDICYLI